MSLRHHSNLGSDVLAAADDATYNTPEGRAVVEAQVRSCRLSCCCHCCHYCCSTTAAIATASLITHSRLDSTRLYSQVMERVRRHFSPELLNRVDKVCMFDRLSRANMLPIVDLQLASLQERLRTERQIELTVSPEARRWLAEQGYDPQYGARPLRRAIQEYVYSPLATELLAGGVRDGEPVTVELAAGAAPTQQQQQQRLRVVGLHKEERGAVGKGSVEA